MTDVLIVITLVVAALTLGVGVYEVILIRGRFQQEDTAEVVPDGFAFSENLNAPAGWQASVGVRNVGGATAYRMVFWIADTEGNPLTHQFPGVDALQPGEPDELRADLPSEPGERNLALWIGWRDGRGYQTRDTGYRV